MLLPPVRYDGPLHDVFQFAHVAGPAVPLQGLQSLGLDGVDLLGHAPGKTPQEMQRQRFDVLRPFPQRRQLDGDHVQAVIEILTEAPFANLTLQILVGGGHETHIHLFWAGRTDRDEVALLDDPQQFGLYRRTDIPDLVQKERAAVGLLQQTFLVHHRAGEGTAQMPEQLAFQQGVGQGGAVQRNKRFFPAQAVAVQGAGDQFLAGARFTQDHDVGIAGRHLEGQVVDLAEPGAGKNRRFMAAADGELFAQPAVLACQALKLQHMVYQAQHLLLGEGFDQVVVGTLFDGLHCVVHGTEGGHHDHRQFGAGLLDPLRAPAGRPCPACAHPAAAGPRRRHPPVRAAPAGRCPG